MSRRRRAWSIRTRIAASFAVASMVLTTAVLVFVNLASQQSFAAFAVDGVHGSEPFPAASVASVAPDPDAPAPRGAAVAVVREVSSLQWQWSVVGIVAAGFLSGGLGWYLSRRTLRPIDRITATTNRISASNLHERIALDGPDDELRRLATTIDALIARLETAFESQRRFVAQASHELRTPLAVQRATLQIGLHDGAGPADVAAARAQLLEHNRRTEHLVESLLVLAEADRGLDERRVPVDLGTLAAEAAAGAVDAARAAEVTVTCAIGTAPRDRTAATTVTGEPTLLRQVFVNLVGNAVEYNEPGGFVRVLVDETGCTVENSGPLVPDAVAARLVEPFRRHGQRGSGRHSGLGLSIVDAVVRAHGWRMDVRARAGGGLVVRIGVSSVQPRVTAP